MGRTFLTHSVFVPWKREKRLSASLLFKITYSLRPSFWEAQEPPGSWFGKGSTQRPQERGRYQDREAKKPGRPHSLIWGNVTFSRMRISPQHLSWLEGERTGLSYFYVSSYKGWDHGRYISSQVPSLFRLQVYRQTAQVAFCSFLRRLRDRLEMGRGSSGKEMGTQGTLGRTLRKSPALHISKCRMN